MAKLVSRLAQHVLESHPNQAANVLERLPELEAIRLLEGARISESAMILERLSPSLAAKVLGGIKSEKTAKVLETLAIDSATRLIRRVDGPRQEEILSLVESDRARSIRAILQFREGTVGALMDPDVLALPAELTARESLQRVKKDPELARYNIYVVKEDQRLVGALNLRELLLAPGRTPLGDLMRRNPYRVIATESQSSIIAHPGWKVVHSLPVVDSNEAFLGAIRYRVLRQLEDASSAARDEDVDAGAALAQVIGTAARGILDSFTGVQGPENGRNSSGSN